jgi:polar amino acid transport system permease protein
MSRADLVFLAVVALGLLLLAQAVDREFVAALDFGVVWQYRATLARGFVVTVAFTTAGVVAGFLFGLVLGLASQSRRRLVRWLVAAHVELWRNTPLLVQLIWIHFALPFATGIITSPAESAFIALTANVGAYYAEIVRAGIGSVPPGQWDAARALGLSRRMTWRKVILPQTLRIILPPSVNLVLSVFKATAILSILAVGELMRETVRISNFTYRPVELYTAAALIYVAAGLAISHFASRIERRLERGWSGR